MNKLLLLFIFFICQSCSIEEATLRTNEVLIKHNDSIVGGYIGMDPEYIYSFKLDGTELICEKYILGKQEKAEIKRASSEKILKICSEIIANNIDSEPPFPPPGAMMGLELENGKSKYYTNEAKSPFIDLLLKELKNIFKK